MQHLAFPLFFGGLFLAASLILCWLIGHAAILAEDRGPRAVNVWGAALMIGAAIVGALLAKFFMQDAVWQPYYEHGVGISSFIQVHIAIAVAVLFALFTALPAIDMVRKGQVRADYLRKMAPRARDFALKHFDGMDEDKSGLLILEKIDWYRTSAQFSQEDERMFDFLISQFAQIGHVIGSATNTDYVWYIAPYGGMTKTKRTETIFTYGIDRRDLEGYPERVVDKYKKW